VSASVCVYFTHSFIKTMPTRSLWFLLVLLLVISDRAQGWRRRRRRRCPVANCVVSHWSSWSGCTVVCGSAGGQWRSRYVVRGASCGGSCPYALSQYQACNRWCYNGGTLQQTWCSCKSGYSGQCCKGGKHLKGSIEIIEQETFIGFRNTLPSPWSSRQKSLIKSKFLVRFPFHSNANFYYNNNVK